MKKISIIVLLSFVTFTSSAQGLSWAFPFVVWEGHVYEVTNEKVSESDIGQIIGEVKTIPDDMTGEYYGNASNAYPKGTKYYKINNLKTDTNIAVEVEENQWKKASYTHDAPFHWMNLLSKILPFIITILIIFILFVGFRKLKANFTS
ncbi:hypothetical protein [Metabacillus litoralis]|uniref:hypothetical protein n=1 Tax=Metabacillus litoralis TaxID=152268 RepID=UPI001CFE0667|nr:hypothetical protein [Metabacillus litoralis]